VVPEQPVPIITVTDVPFGCAHNQLALTPVTVTAPLIPTDDDTATEDDVVAPGPEMLKLTGFGEKVRVCAVAVAELPTTAMAARRQSSDKQLSLLKFFSKSRSNCTLGPEVF
jgi:hypothetical protein